MKILFVHSSLGMGGISMTIIHRMNYLAANTDFVIHYLNEWKNDDQLNKKLHKGIQVECLDFSNPFYKKTPRLIAVDSLIYRKKIKNQLQKFIDQIQPDVITSLDESIPRRIIPFLQTPAIKVIEFRNSMYRKGINKRLQNISPLIQLKRRFHPFKLIYGSNKRIHNKYDYAILLTNEDLEDRKYLKIKTRMIYNTSPAPIKVEEFNKRDNIIIGVGRIEAEKKFEDLVCAIYLIKDKISSWRIYIYGIGNKMDYLNQLIKEYGLAEIIFLKGKVYDLDEIYNNSKILISTSLTEAFGRAILEAFLYKIPVISYDCKCGPKEIIADGVNGFLIRPDVQKLSEKILELISNPKMLNQFSENTFQDLHKFEEEKIMNEWIDFYNSLDINSDN